MSNFCFLFILLRSVSWAKFFYFFYAFVSPLWWKFFVVVDFFVYFRMFIILFMCSPCFKFLFVIIVFLWPFFSWDIYHSMNFCWNLYALTKNLCWNLFVWIWLPIFLYILFIYIYVGVEGVTSPIVLLNIPDIINTHCTAIFHVPFFVCNSYIRFSFRDMTTITCQCCCHKYIVTNR